MAIRGTIGSTALDRLRDRYERTDKKCPDCGFVDTTRNWTSMTNGREIVYEHVCPSCGASREHTFRLGR